MTLVFIAGPFRAANAWEIEQNIRRAETLALDAWRAGFAVICPHTNARFFQGAAPDDIWLRGDLEMLGRCDAVLLVAGWERSSGTAGEIEHARQCGIPAYESLAALIEGMAA
ncbi:MAG: DUF7768 domain-containing protein [Planctomycetota bacterium]|jgi:nucleoside 2-deoxyribosyltransferase